MFMNLPTTTSGTIPGYKISEVFGVAHGSALRRPTADLHHDSFEERRAALQRLRNNARDINVNVNAVISVRFDSIHLPNGVVEITAYGTATRIEAESSPVP